MIDRVAVAILLITTGLKILLIPAYHSTDFEVHRNWLAITHSKPWQEWYTDEASPSEWTLDYPPLFAWMEYFLSHIAKFFDPEMLNVDNFDYASRETIRFQRYSVIFTEGLLLAATWWVTRRWPACRRRLALFLVAANPGIIIVDHIHFQYNGNLLGIFVLSIWTVASGSELLGAALFASLLCFKHIFLYAAPAFFVFLLRYYCRGSIKVSVLRFISLGIVVLTILGVSLGPFIFLAGQGGQLAQRMFPVSRGLLHAYWAPNFWALYAAADKVLAIVLLRFGKISLLDNLLPKTAVAGMISKKATLTGGLVGEASFTILPNISSSMTMLCVLCSMLPCLITTWRRPLPGRFARAAVTTTLTAFMFGYHVHEKAILMPLIPFALLAAGGTDSEAPREFAFLSIIGTYSLFPLLIRNEEYGIKIMLLVVYLSVGLPWLQDPEYWTELGKLTLLNAEEEKKENGDGGVGSKNSALPPLTSPSRSRRAVLFTSLECLYLWGLIPLELYCLVGHKLLFGQSNKLPFLPLLLTSVYCAAGNMYCWLKMTGRYCAELVGNTSDKKKKNMGKKKADKGNAVQEQQSGKGTAAASGRAGQRITRSRRYVPRQH